MTISLCKSWDELKVPAGLLVLCFMSEGKQDARQGRVVEAVTGWNEVNLRQNRDRRHIPVVKLSRVSFHHRFDPSYRYGLEQHRSSRLRTSACEILVIRRSENPAGVLLYL